MKVKQGNRLQVLPAGAYLASMENEVEVTKCPSCHEEMRGQYCAQCGERRYNPSGLTLPVLFRQFMEAVFNIDNKLVSTLRKLIFQPGRLTKDYNEGRRMKDVRPFQLFVLVNLIFFSPCRMPTCFGHRHNGIFQIRK